MLVTAALIIAAVPAAQAQGTGASGVPFGQRTRVEARYDDLYGCYVGYMEGKGFDLDTPDRVLARWDRRARAACAHEVRRYRQVVSPQKFEADWNDIWNDYWSRL
jgi:hypothetical protein